MYLKVFAHVSLYNMRTIIYLKYLPLHYFKSNTIELRGLNGWKEMERCTQTSLIARCEFA